MHALRCPQAAASCSAAPCARAGGDCAARSVPQCAHASRPAALATLRRSRSAASAAPQPRRVLCRSAGEWQAVVDPASGRTYFWNTVSNQTSWTPPADAAPADAAPQPAAAAADVPSAAAAKPAAEQQLPFPELEALLSATQPVYLSKVVEPHRDAAFSDAFTEYLTAKIDAASDEAERERLTKLRARLANPLIRQPPPFL